MKTVSLFLLTGIICMGTISCKFLQKQEQKQVQKPKKEFRLPDVPDLITTPEDRAIYLSLHYWDHYDFDDTTLISRPEITEQAFVDFICILPYSSVAQAAVDTLFACASRWKVMTEHFASLGDKYLYEPNSPMHNEELYILFLNALVENHVLTEDDRMHRRHLLEMALKNRPGNVAADFSVVCRNGKSKRLSEIKSDYVLVYFNDPDCDDCNRVKEQLTLSPAVNGLLEAGRLQLLSVCVEGKTPAWDQAEFPATWIDSYDAGQHLTREEVYDLKAMPSLYLLDAEKRVILKDATFEQVEEVLS